MYKLIFLLLFVLLFQTSFAEIIKGIVTDKKTGEAIVGATVTVKDDRSTSTISGLNGSFRLSVKSFPVTVIVSSAGFNSEELNFQSDNELLTVKLTPSVIELKELQIISSNDKNTDKYARDIEKFAASIQNVVSAKTIEISPDITVANVIQRVSGVTLERNSTGDGQYANLRGMDKRYNYTLVNGIKIPSPDNKNRFVPLDIFPSEMLARLEVAKSLTANMEGDGIGGAINMVMRDAPSARQITVNLSAGYNTLFFDRPFYSYSHQSIVTQSPYELYSSLYAAKPRDFSGELLNIKSAKPRPNIFFNTTYGDRFFKDRLGVMLGISFQNSFRGSNSSNFGSSLSTSDASNLPVLTGLNQRTFSDEQMRAGIHGKLDYRFSEKNKIQWYNTLLDFRTYQVRDEKKIDFSIGYDPANGSYNLSYDTRFRYSHQNIYHSTLNGEHLLFANKLKVDWTAVYSKAVNEVPDNSTVHTVSTVKNNIENQISVVTLGGAERRWEHNSDKDLAGQFNLYYTKHIGKISADFSTGALYRDKKRENFFNEYQFRPYDESKPAGSQTNLIKTVDWNKYSEIKFSVFNPFGSTGDPLNYTASEKIAAGYLQAKFSGTAFQLITGLRIENTDQGYNLLNPTTGVKNTGKQIYTDLLPGVHFKYSINDKKSIRASYVKAINRPSFFEIVPYKIINDDFTEMGNPDLRHTIGHNFDLRFEYYPKPAEQFLLGLFYKKIIDPIEFGMLTQGQGSFYMPTNFGTANNYGVEIDITKYFFNFGFKFNYTFTKSSINTSKIYYILNPDVNSTEKVLLKTTGQTRQLNGQAAHLGNFTLLYKNTRSGIDGQLSCVYTGEKLIAVSRYLNHDLWQSGFVQLDGSLEKKLKNRITLFAKAINIINTPVKQFVKKYNGTNENIKGYESYKSGTLLRKDIYGTNIQLGIKYKMK